MIDLSSSKSSYLGEDFRSRRIIKDGKVDTGGMLQGGPGVGNNLELWLQGSDEYCQEEETRRNEEGIFFGGKEEERERDLTCKPHSFVILPMR